MNSDIKNLLKIENPTEEDAMRLELLAQGLTDREIGERLGVTTKVIAQWRVDNGLPSRTETISRKRMELYMQGLSDQEIAEQTGATKKQVTAWRYYRKLPKENRPEPGQQPAIQKMGRPHGSGGIGYKEIVPEEKWPLIEDFFAKLCQFSDIANEHGLCLDVGRFMTEYTCRTSESERRRRRKNEAHG